MFAIDQEIYFSTEIYLRQGVSGHLSFLLSVQINRNFIVAKPTSLITSANLIPLVSPFPSPAHMKLMLHSGNLIKSKTCFDALIFFTTACSCKPPENSSEPTFLLPSGFWQLPQEFVTCCMSVKNINQFECKIRADIQGNNKIIQLKSNKKS